MRKNASFLVLLILSSFSVFAQSQPSDSLIQRYRKEVRRFMRQAGFNGKKARTRKVNTKIWCDSLARKFYGFLHEIDSGAYSRDTSFIQVSCIPFQTERWDGSLLKWVELINVDQIGSSSIVWEIQFGKGQPSLWTYCAPLFSQDGKWSIMCYSRRGGTYYSESGATIIYKKTWRRWRKYKVLSSWSNHVIL